MVKGKKRGPKKPSSKNLSIQKSRLRKLSPKQSRQSGDNSTKRIPGSFKLAAETFSLLKAHWKILGGIMLVYAILNIILASGFTNISTAFEVVKAGLNGDRNLGNAFSDFGSLVGSSGTANSESTQFLLIVLLIIGSLVIIWSLRHLLAGHKIRVKQAYYQSMAPLLPFLLVLLVIFIQLLPVTLGTSFVAIALSAIISSGVLETTILSIAFIVLAGWSLYMLCSSVFALYIVTLPNMEPRQALRSAKNLVQSRRANIIRKLLFLPILILLIMAVLVIPLILFVQFLVVPVFYILSIVAFLFAHTYLYNLYRNLLDE